MNDQPTLLVLQGTLHENLEFSVLARFEVAAAPRRQVPTPAADLVVELRDAAGRQIVADTPEASFHSACGPQQSPVRTAPILAIIPSHPDGRAVVVRHGDRILYEARVGELRPQVDHLHVTLEDGGHALRATWAVTSGAADSTALSLVLDGGREFPVGQTDGEEAVLDLRTHAGRGEARLRVSASREFRTGEATSAAFRLPDDSVAGRILEPRSGAERDADQPASFVGNLSGTSGAPLPWDAQRIAWVLDDRALDDSRQIATCPPLSPGRHVVQLRYEDTERGPVVLDEVAFGVRERTEAQQAYWAALERYFALTGDRPAPELEPQ